MLWKKTETNATVFMKMDKDQPPPTKEQSEEAIARGDIAGALIGDRIEMPVMASIWTAKLPGGDHKTYSLKAAAICLTRQFLPGVKQKRAAYTLIIRFQFRGMVPWTRTYEINAKSDGIALEAAEVTSMHTLHEFLDDFDAISRTMADGEWTWSALENGNERLEPPDSLAVNIVNQAGIDLACTPDKDTGWEATALIGLTQTPTYGITQSYDAPGQDAAKDYAIAAYGGYLAELRDDMQSILDFLNADGKEAETTS